MTNKSFRPFKKYEKGKVYWQRQDFKFGCCDCGLVHRLRLTVKGKLLIFEAERDEKATKYLRKRERIIVKNVHSQASEKEGA